MGNFLWQVGPCGCACRFPIPADFIFLLDVTGSMGGVSSSHLQRIYDFVQKCITSEEVSDWRAKIIAFGDYQWDRDLWYQDSGPFVRTYNDFIASCNAFKEVGGGDGDESHLDAVYRAVNLDVSTEGESPELWRPFKDAARVIVLYSYSDCHDTLVIPEAKGKTSQDVIDRVKSKNAVVAYGKDFHAPNFQSVGGCVDYTMPEFFKQTINLARTLWVNGGY